MGFGDANSRFWTRVHTQKLGGKPEMKISVISYAFHKLAEEGKMDLFGYLESCRYRFGLQTADIWNRSLTSLDKDYLDKVKDALHERELVLVCLAVDDADLWVDDPSERERNYQNALAYLRAAEILGAETVRFNSGGGWEDVEWTDEQFDYVLQRWREYAQRAYDNGYKVGPENHWGPEAVPGTLRKLCEAVDSPGFGVLLHFARWRGPDSKSGDEIISPWTIHTHLTPRLDDVSLRQKMTLAREAGYKGCWGVELVSTRYSEVGLSIARVRDVLEQWRQEGGPGQ
jgi:hypothetical protein